MFYKKLEEICKLNNISVTAATTKLGISKGTATNWKKGASPNSDVVVQFSQLFNVSTDYFLMDKINNFSYDKTHFLTAAELTLIERYRSVSDELKNKIDIFLEIATVNNSTYLTPIGAEASKLSYVSEDRCRDGEKTIPILGMVAAGKPIEAINNQLGNINTTLNVDFALIVSGNSMYPLIKDGEHVLVKKCEELENNDIGVFYLNNSVTCKKWFKNDKMIKLISINPAYEDYSFILSEPQNENLDFKIEGKVVLEH